MTQRTAETPVQLTQEQNALSAKPRPQTVQHTNKVGRDTLQGPGNTEIRQAVCKTFGQSSQMQA